MPTLSPWGSRSSPLEPCISRLTSFITVLVPVISIEIGAAPHMIGMAGTSPAMTSEFLRGETKTAHHLPRPAAIPPQVQAHTCDLKRLKSVPQLFQKGSRG